MYSAELFDLGIFTFCRLILHDRPSSTHLLKLTVCPVYFYFGRDLGATFFASFLRNQVETQLVYV